MQTLATLWHSVRWLTACAVFLLLAACSGGGGGGGDSDTGDGFTISATSLSFSAQQFGSLPPTQDIQASFTHPEAYYMGAAYPPGVTPVSWLDIQITGSGNTRTFHFSVNTTGLTPGTYTTTIGLGIARSDGSIIAYKNVAVSYTVVPKLTASPASLNFAFVIGGIAPVSQGVNIGGTGATWTASANQPWVILNNTGGTAPAVLGVGVDTNLAPGAYNATIQISDGFTPLSVPVTYTVRASNIAVSPTQLTFSAINGNPSPPPANVTVSSETGIPISYTTSVTYSPGASGWLSVPSNGTAPGTLAVGHSTNVAPGSYTADVIVTPSNGAPSVTIRVNYTVTASSLTLNPAAVTFSLDANSTTADSDIKRTVIVSQTGSVLNWTATSSVPWLTVSPGSGTNYGTVTLMLVPAQLDALENGQHTATVTFTSNGPYVSNQTKFLPVTLNLNVPKVNYVAPYVAYTNTSDRVIIRGSGFGSITNQRLRIGSASVDSFTVISDSEIHVTHPVLAEGSYTVRVENQLGITHSRANLVVVSSPTFTYHVIPTSLTRSRTIYDAERLAVYTNNMMPFHTGPLGVARIERHRFTSSGWVTDSLLLNGIPVDMSMTPDGRELIALSPSSLYHINLDTWSISRRLDISSVFSYPHNLDVFCGIAMSNDGNALVYLEPSSPYLFRYNVLSGQFDQPLGSTYILNSSSPPVSSMDGSRILVGQSGAYGFSKLYYLDSSTWQLVQVHPDLVTSRMRYDRTGSFSIIDGTVYSRQFQPLGTEWNMAIPAISPDGTRGYGYSYTGNMLHTYDLTSPNNIGGFNEIGTGIAIPDVPGDYATMEISSDGKALFISGVQNFIIMSVP